MQIIGIAGRIGAGKTRAAGIIAMLLSEQRFSVKIDSFVWLLRDLALKRFGSFDRDRDRAWMRETATAMRRDDPHCFVRDMILRNHYGLKSDWPRRANDVPADFLIIPDVRFPDEAALCREHGVLIFIDGTHRQDAARAAEHETESHITDMMSLADYIIPKQPTLARLEDAVKAMLDVGGHLKK